MKRLFYLTAFVGMTLWALTGCQPKNPPEPTPPQEDTIPAPQEDTIPSSFPKKQLIEEFTSQSCIHCPSGMDALYEAIGNDSNWVLVLHHQGYAPDHFSIDGSKEITDQMGINSAPCITINRSATKHPDDYGRSVSELVFHPGYLPESDMSQFEKTTYASVVLKNEYDPSTRELTVYASGAIARKDSVALKLTVMIKESGMIDTQEDYYSFAGWKEFRHANAVRAFLTAPKGDPIEINEQRYADTLRFTLSEQWVAENCMVVAFLSEDFQPVVQAEQKPVVAGSKGGADLKHGGITLVPVSSYYPEINATSGPQDYSKKDKDSLSTSYAYYMPIESMGITYWMIEAYNSSSVVRVGLINSVPYTRIYFFTDINAPVNTVPTGNYEFVSTYLPGTAEAGLRDDTEQTISGSMFYYLNLAYFNRGYMRITAQWLIADGLLSITNEGWTVNGHARNGSDIRLVGSPIKIQGPLRTPARIASPKTKKIEYCK